MTVPKPKFFEGDNKLIAHLEWEAIRVIHFEGSHMDIADAYPKFEQRQFYWIDPFQDKATKAHHEIKRRLHENEIGSLNEFYEALQPLFKPKPRGKMLKDKKARTAQSAYQKQQLGDAFIDNKALLKDAREMAFKVAESNKDDNVLNEAVTSLLMKHGFSEFTLDQQKTLWNYIERQADKHLVLERVEAAILDDNDKNLYFMWGRIKRWHPKGHTFAWKTADAAKLAKCSKSDVKRLMSRLEKLGAIKCIQEGKAGSSGGRAAIYRREA
jgi:hypothetical protein